LKRYNKFNFVFFLRQATPIYKFISHDAFALSNVRVVDLNFTNANGIQTVNFIPYHPRNNPSAFKDIKSFDINSPQVFAQDFPEKNPIVFLFSPQVYHIFKEIKFFQYLRSNYPGCKLVCSLTDPVHHFQNFFGMFLDKANTREIFSTFDLVITYIQLDAINYGMTFFEGSYSVLPYVQPKEDVDIFFAGGIKNRFEKIIRAYEYFKSAGFVCDFHIVGVPDTPPSVYNNDLHINRFIPYHEVLARVLHSKAVLDISHIQNYGLTVRYFESLAYNKNFITDNPFYRQARFASPKLFLIDRSLEIDKEQFMAAAKLSSNYRNEYSPLRMINFLESILNA